MIWRDRDGWPIELWLGRPFKNFVRLCCQWIRGNWWGGRRCFKHEFNHIDPTIVDPRNRPGCYPTNYGLKRYESEDEYFGRTRKENE